MPLLGLSVARLDQFSGWRAFRRNFLSEREQLLLRHPVPDERGDLLSGALERCDDDEIVGNLIVIADRPDRDAEKIAAADGIENRHRIEAAFLERQIRELGG